MRDYPTVIPVNEIPDRADFTSACEMRPLPILAGRYQIDHLLGTHATGGRMTYLAQAIDPQHPTSASIPNRIYVVIKEFQFATTGSHWQGYDTISREFEMLQAINHPGIPRYIEQFETDRAVYLVQEYKDAPTLAQCIADPTRTIDLATLRQTAIDLLEILVYLQSRIPPILHRDLKPENILLSPTGDVFLVDFGFAQRGIRGQGEGTAASLVRGTLGFMAPEQILNRSLTTATDLYGLGASLLCWLTGTPSDRVGDWIGEGFKFEVDRAVPQLPQEVRHWLAKLVAPEIGDRFDSARSALEMLRTISFELEATPNITDPPTNPNTAPNPTITPPPPVAAIIPTLHELQRSFGLLPIRRLVWLAIGAAVFIWGVDGWWSLSLGAGRAISAAIRSLLSIG